MAVHGPQDPRDIGREVGTPLPQRGPNPNTGSVRLPFGLADDGREYAKPVPMVHHLLVQWLIPNERINGGPMFGHFEGGVTIFQVAKKQIWYVRSWIAREQQKPSGLDPKALKRHRPKSLEVFGKLIFVRRTITLPSGEEYETGELTSAVAGGPSVLGVKHTASGNGHPDYPKFPAVEMKIASAKFNPTRYTLLAPCLNRQGFLCSHDKHVAILNGVTAPSGLLIAPDWDRFDTGDGLSPHADVQAGIQTEHAAPAPTPAPAGQ